MAWQPSSLEEGLKFRPLDDDEEREFRRYAQESPPPDGVDSWEIYHPVCRDEWLKRGIGPTILLALVALRGDCL